GDGGAFGSGTGSTFALELTDEGQYGITLAVSDSDGNVYTTTADLVVNNAAPVLDARTFGSPLQAANPAPAAVDRFGNALATAGGYYLVGAALDDTVAGDAGAAYLYDAATNALVRTFLNPRAAAVAGGRRCGASVAFVGDRLLIGAPGSDLNGGNGAAYLFDVAGNLLATFTGPSPGSGDEFGGAVAAFGGQIVIAAPKKDVNGVDGVGEVYLY